MSERGKIQPIRDPATAIAMSKCWLNTWARAGLSIVGNPDSFHPEKCVFCEEPRDYLVQALEEFKEWSFISADIDDSTPLRTEVERWFMLSAEEQLAQVERAQGYMEVPEVVHERVKDWWNQDDQR